MRMGGRPGAPRALAVPTGPLGSAGPPQTAANIFSCIPERLTENWLGPLVLRDGNPCGCLCVSFELTHLVLQFLCRTIHFEKSTHGTPTDLAGPTVS